MSQSNELYKEQVNRNSIINYSRIKPQIKNIMSKNIDEINNMRDNYKKNISVCVNKEVNSNKPDKLDSIIILFKS
jgi:hypothetical protein